MAVNSPRTCFQFDDGWRDVSPYVRAASLSLQRGRPNEVADGAPSRASLTLDDRDGRWTRTNPMSPYAGQLGRYVGVRIGAVVSRATFGGTQASGWMTTDTGQTWLHQGIGGTVLGTDFSQAGGTGRMSVPTTAAYRASYLQSGGLVRDVRVEFDVSVPGLAAGDVTGAALEVDAVVRQTADYYHGRVELRADQQVWCSIHRFAGGQIAGPAAVPGLTYTGQTLRVAMEIEARRMRIKVWPATAIEPGFWHLGTEDDTLTGPGSVGVRVGVSAGNTNVKPVVFHVDNFLVEIPRLAGEATGWVPTWTREHTLGSAKGDRTVAVQVADPMQRLRQHPPVLASAARRAILPPAPWTPTDVWMLDDASGAELAVNAMGHAAGWFQREAGVTPNTGAITWGADAGTLPVAACVELTTGGRLNLPVTSSGLLPTSWSVCWAQRVSADAGAFTRFACADPADNVNITWFTDGSYTVYLATSDPFGSVLLFSGSLAGVGYDGVWHSVALSAYDAGAGNIGYWLAIDGVVSGIIALGFGFTTLRQVQMVAPPGTDKPVGWSSVLVFPELINAGTPTLAVTYHDAVMGHTGERVGTRLARLADEHRLTVVSRSTPSATRRCGAQAMATLPRLLLDTAAVDGGTIGGSRAEPTSLTFRGVSDLWNRAPIVTLSYDQVATLHPAEDDQATVNSATIKRADGGEATATVTTGALGIDSIGVADYGRTLPLYDLEDTRRHAEHVVALGTTDDPRYALTLNLRAPALSTAQTWAVLDLDDGDRVDLTATPGAGLYDPVRQVVRGITETYAKGGLWTVTYALAPALPYQVGVVGTGLAATTSARLAAGCTAGATTISVASDPGDLWATGAQSVGIVVDGEAMTVTNVAGAASPQTLTVARAVNGVTLAHAANAAVRLRSDSIIRPTW